MRFLVAWLALALTAACALIALSEVDIDYSHSVVGTGTLITDYHMGARESSEASGKVRGTGNVVNKYQFLSANDSRNFTIEDQFILSGATNASELTLGGLPSVPGETDRFRLTGASWAERLVVMSAMNTSLNTSNSSQPSQGSLQNISLPTATRDAQLERKNP